MKHKHPTLAYLVIAVASIVFSAAQPALDQAPEGNAVALANGITTLVDLPGSDDRGSQ